ncbi:MAG: metallophosphoesterase family protein [Geodermatophilaceae bacterium]
MNVVVLADTHAPRRWRGATPRVTEHLRAADLILHAGDVCTRDVLDELSGYAPVLAVRGNNDGPEIAAWGAPDQLITDIDGLSVGMIHDSGASKGRLSRMRRLFPTCELVVFGHSHIPMDITGEGLQLFNPGSPTDRRRQSHGTLGLLDIRRGRLDAARIVAVT